MSHRSFGLAPCALSALLLLAAQLVHAYDSDPPGRIAYLSDSRGEISYSPAGEDQWTGLERNRPLTRGDRLWSDQDSRVEFQIGSAALRIGSSSALEILELHDQSAQLQLTQGTLNLRVRRLRRGETFEIATPMLAFVIQRAGRYRIDVDEYDSTTTIVVWEGAGEAYGESGSFPLRRGDAATFYDHDLRDYELASLPREDPFDRYCLDRDARLDRSGSLRYVGDDLAGYSQLDDYGRWRRIRNHGDVWFPSQVSVGWAPYRDGHWVWQEPWGWTWVDNAPWGFAPSHYGRLVSISNRWGWIPGPRNVRPVYAPALVAFVGGHNWSLSISLGGNRSPIGWFPLGPRDVYVPSYRASRDYFTRVNINNTVINNTVINNYYGGYSRGETVIAQGGYANRSVSNSITAVPQSVFVNAQPVGTARLELDRRGRSSGELTRVAPVAPSMVSVLGSARSATSAPPAGNFERAVLARTPPPQREVPFAQRERLLQRTPGLAVEQAAKPADQGQVAERARRIQLINDRQAATNLRETQSRRTNDSKPGERAVREPRPDQTGNRNVSERNDGTPARRVVEPAAPVSERGPPREQRDSARSNAPTPQTRTQPQTRPTPEPRSAAQPQAPRESATQRRQSDRPAQPSVKPKPDAREQAIAREETQARDQAEARRVRDAKPSIREDERQAPPANRQQRDARDRAIAQDAQQARDQAEAQRVREAAAERSVREERANQRDAQQQRLPPAPKPQQRTPPPAAAVTPAPARDDAAERGRPASKPPMDKPRRDSDKDEDEEDLNGNGKPDKDENRRRQSRRDE